MFSLSTLILRRGQAWPQLSLCKPVSRQGPSSLTAAPNGQPCHCLTSAFSFQPQEQYLPAVANLFLASHLPSPGKPVPYINSG